MIRAAHTTVQAALWVLLAAFLCLVNSASAYIDPGARNSSHDAGEPILNTADAAPSRQKLSDVSYAYDHDVSTLGQLPSNAKKAHAGRVVSFSFTYDASGIRTSSSDLHDRDEHAYRYDFSKRLFPLASKNAVSSGTYRPAYAYDNRNHSVGGSREYSNECTGETPPPPRVDAGENTVPVYDPATGVVYYVRQNPWTFFDPLGLEIVSKLNGQLDAVESERSAYAKDQEAMGAKRYHLRDGPIGVEIQYTGYGERMIEFGRTVRSLNQRIKGIQHTQKYLNDRLNWITNIAWVMGWDRSKIPSNFADDVLDDTNPNHQWYFDVAEAGGKLEFKAALAGALATGGRFKPARIPHVRGPVAYLEKASAPMQLRHLAPKTTLPIQFGKGTNQVSHAFRHIDGVVDQTKAVTAITNDLNAAASVIKSGNNIRKLVVDGVEVTYNAFRLPDGTINVGRITVPR